MNWGLLPLFVFYGWLNGYATLKLHHWTNRRREVLFLKHLKLEHPDSVITLSSVETSDKEALAKIERQLNDR